jgi:hypothetical protein
MSHSNLLNDPDLLCFLISLQTTFGGAVFCVCTVTRLRLGSQFYCGKGVQGGSRSKFRSFPSFSPTSVVYIKCHREPDSKGALAMEWVTPQHEEIDLNCEISSYANAEL